MSADPSIRRAGRSGRPRRLSLVIALLLFLGVVGGGVWAVNHYRTCQEAAPGPKRPVTFTVEADTPGARGDGGSPRRGSDPVRRIRGEHPPPGHGEVRPDPGRFLRAHHRDDARCCARGPHDPAAGGPDRGARDPRGAPAHADRREGPGGSRHPRETVPEGGGERSLRLAAVPPGGVADAGGFPLPEELRVRRGGAVRQDRGGAAPRAVPEGGRSPALRPYGGVGRHAVRARDHRLDDRGGGRGGPGPQG